MHEDVLLVEDSLFVCKVIQNTLSQQPDLTIKTAHSLQAATELVEKQTHPFFLALIDLNLPDALGDEIIEYISLQKIPFIVFSGHESTDIRKVCEQRHYMIDYVNTQNSFSYDYLATLFARLRKNKDLKALVIDDSVVVRKHLVSMLERTMLQTYTASTAQEAIDLLSQPHNIRLIMVDNHLPDMTGPDLCKRIRDIPQNNDVSIIGFSAGEDGSLVSHFLKSGANDYMSKRFCQEELLCRVIQNLDMQDYISAYKDASNRDFLTGLYNRRFLMDSIPLIQADSQREGTTFSVAMIDIDYFKKINDTLGHDAGDLVLKTLAKELKEQLREPDLLARVGGEEFCIIAKKCSIEEAHKVFENMRHHIQENVKVMYDEKTIGITASIGVCCESDLSFDEMLKIADTNLYSAKESGRNHVVVS